MTDRPATAPQPRLLDRVRAVLRARHYSRRTEESYVGWIRRYIHFTPGGTPVTWARPRSPAS